MKNVSEKYQKQEGESMGSWQSRVSQQIYEEKYADKTPEQMRKIYEKYQKEHPDEFGGSHARVVSPELSAIYQGISEAAERVGADKKNTSETRKKVSGLTIIARLLHRLKAEPAPEKDFEGRMLKDFKRRFKGGKE